MYPPSPSTVLPIHVSLPLMSPPPEKSHCHEKAVPDFVSLPRIRRRYLPTTKLSRWNIMYRTIHLNLAHGWNK